MSCTPLITDPFEFPRRNANRPALPHIGYRIGRYADFLEAMHRHINLAPALAAWTHREADDPGIALLEGAAILGDILTFYQEHYANEAFLRTAAWRDSIAELVRLTGYRLAPGLGGRATFAIEVRGAQPLRLRAGFPLKTELVGQPQPAEFQTAEELVALPHLGRFHLYRPRSYGFVIPAGATRFELTAAEGASDLASLDAVALKPGEQLLLLPLQPGWTTSSAALSTQSEPQIVKVKSITRIVGRVIVEIDAPLMRTWGAPVTAYRINRSLRHFGHNAPPRTLTNTKDGSGKITGAIDSATLFQRHVNTDHDCTNTSASLPLPPTLIPLDSEVSDLRPGQRIVVQTRIADANGSVVALSVVRRIARITSTSLSFGNLTGAASLLELDAALVDHSSKYDLLSDVRDYRLLEVTSAALSLKPVSFASGGAYANGSNALCFFGTAEQARPLAGRRLYLAHADGRSGELVCTNAAADFDQADTQPRIWTLSFDRAPKPFLRADFDEAVPTVEVFGNLVDASQGKAEREAVLGNGDARQSWQTFALAKSPLTYFVNPGGLPPHAPELEVRVNGRLWQRVDSFFGRGGDETVYIVREDAQNRSFVQFGDGATGARLPSGLKNVVARWRSGNGASGALKPGSTPSAAERPPGFDKVSLAGIVSGGAAAEPGDKAREAAPGKVQSLGRLVSLGDFESETLSLPGVVAASAAWDLYQGIPALVLRVLLQAGREAEFAAVRSSIAHLQRCRGPDRFPVVVQQALSRYVFLDLHYARDPLFRAEDVAAAVRAALGLAGDVANERSGLFGLHARRLGAREYASRVEGITQNVAGVLWCRVASFGRFAAGLLDPTAILLPPAPRSNATSLPCTPTELLQLAAPHLHLVEVAAAVAGECA